MKRYFLIISAILFSIVLQAQNSSQWRGQERNGVYNETGLLKAWPAGGPELLWKFEGLGEGYTSVAIANEKIYITGMQCEELVLYVLDLQGELIAEKEIGKEWNTNHNGTRSTVCVNDGKIYIFNALGTLFCLDETTLNELWRKDIISEFGGRNLRFGMTESPLIVDDKIFITPGGTQHNMVALNKNTGALIWSSPGLGTPSAYCSPLHISGYPVPIVVTCMHQHIIAFNGNTGEMLWSHPQESRNSIHPNMPIYSDGFILSTTGYSGGTWLYRLTYGGSGADLVWKNNDMDNRMGSAIRIGDYIYGSGDRNNNWFCIDWKTGETKYRVTEIGHSNIITADDMLYVYSERGNMYLVKPNPEKLEVVSMFNVTLGDGPHWAHPVIHRGVLYIRQGNVLMAYGIKAR